MSDTLQLEQRRKKKGVIRQAKRGGNVSYKMHEKTKNLSFKTLFTVSCEPYFSLYFLKIKRLEWKILGCIFTIINFKLKNSHFFSKEEKLSEIIGQENFYKVFVSKTRIWLSLCKIGQFKVQNIKWWGKTKKINFTSASLV